MKLAFIYFTYLCDQLMLEYSIDSINRLKQFYDIDIFVVDDSNAPMTNIPSGVIYSKSTFNRNGNLNGKDCLIGIIKEYKKIFDYHNYDWCIKIDPDVYVNHLDWLDSIPSNKQFYQIGVQSDLRKNKFNEPYICYGCFHGLNNNGLINLIKNMNNLQYYIDSTNEYDKNRIAEDYFSCRMICEDNDSINFYINDNFKNIYKHTIDNINKMYFDFKFEDNHNIFIKNMPNKFMHNFFAITFKSIWRSYNSNYKRYDAQCRMKKYMEFMHKNKL